METDYYLAKALRDALLQTDQLTSELLSESNLKNLRQYVITTNNFFKREGYEPNDKIGDVLKVF